MQTLNKDSLSWSYQDSVISGYYKWNTPPPLPLSYVISPSEPLFPILTNISDILLFMDQKKFFIFYWLEWFLGTIEMYYPLLLE